MLFKTHTAFQERLEYTKTADGSWTAEFAGRIHVRVGDSSLERCRRLALEDLDAKLADWISTPRANGRRMARRVLAEARRPKVAATRKRANTKSR